LNNTTGLVEVKATSSPEMLSSAASLSSASLSCEDEEQTTQEELGNMGTLSEHQPSTDQSI
jgi:hypothetical protein